MTEQISTYPALETRKTTKNQKVKTFWAHTYAMVSSRPRGRCVQSLVQWVEKCGFEEGTNKHTQRKKRAKRQKKVKQITRSKSLGPKIPYGLLETKGEMCANFGSDRFRNVDLCKVRTNTHSALYIRQTETLCHLHHKLIGCYNRDEKCLLRGTDWVFK
jgi:hypothetical protein